MVIVVLGVFWFTYFHIGRYIGLGINAARDVLQAVIRIWYQAMIALAIVVASLLAAIFSWLAKGIILAGNPSVTPFIMWVFVLLFEVFLIAGILKTKERSIRRVTLR